MSTGGVEGYRGDAHLRVPEEQAGEPAGAGQDAERGAAGQEVQARATAPEALQARGLESTASMLAADLERALAERSGELTEVSTAELQSRIDALEEELDFLLEYEELLLELLDDPDVGLVDSFWLTYDLWDVRFDIEDIEAELAELKGEVFERELWALFAGAFTATVHSFFDYFRSEDQVARQRLETMVEDSRKRLSFELEQRQRTDQRRERLEQEKRAAASQGYELPPVTAELRAMAERMRPRVEQLMEQPTREGIDALRDELRELRGEQPFRRGR